MSRLRKTVASKPLRIAMYLIAALVLIGCRPAPYKDRLDPADSKSENKEWAESNFLKLSANLRTGTRAERLDAAALLVHFKERAAYPLANALSDHDEIVAYTASNSLLKVTGVNFGLERNRALSWLKEHGYKDEEKPPTPNPLPPPSK